MKGGDKLKSRSEFRREVAGRKWKVVWIAKQINTSPITVYRFFNNENYTMREERMIAIHKLFGWEYTPLS